MCINNEVIVEFLAMLRVPICAPDIDHRKENVWENVAENCVIVLKYVLSTYFCFGNQIMYTFPTFIQKDNHLTFYKYNSEFLRRIFLGKTRFELIDVSKSFRRKCARFDCHRVQI